MELVMDFKHIIFSQGKKWSRKGSPNYYNFCKLFIINNLPSFDGSKMFQFLPYRDNFQIQLPIDYQSITNQLPINYQSITNWHIPVNLLKINDLIHFLTFLLLYFSLRVKVLFQK
jgi:hypothetical protein